LKGEEEREGEEGKEGVVPILLTNKLKFVDKKHKLYCLFVLFVCCGVASIVRVSQ